MAFRLDDIIVDHLVVGFATDFSDNPLYVLSQLTDATIDIKANSEDATDKRGNLIKKFWKSKQGSFSATNAMLNLSIMAAASGEAKELATKDHKLRMPKIIEVKGTETTVDLAGFDPDSVDNVTVIGYGYNGSMTNAYKKGAVASETEFAITSAGKLSLPTPRNAEDKYLIKYFRLVEAGGAVHNSADKFPGTIKLTLKAICVDPCSSDSLSAAYITLPSFQPSPETSINLTTNGKIAYNGDLQVDYCSPDKSLYDITWCDDDLEDD